MMNESELVVVRTFSNRIEAELAKGALEAANIESLVSADDAGSLRVSLHIHGVQLLVRSEDVERATEILDLSASSDGFGT